MCTTESPWPGSSCYSVSPILIAQWILFFSLHSTKNFVTLFWTQQWHFLSFLAVPLAHAWFTSGKNDQRRCSPIKSTKVNRVDPAYFQWKWVLGMALPTYTTLDCDMYDISYCPWWTDYIENVLCGGRQSVVKGKRIWPSPRGRGRVVARKEQQTEAFGLAKTKGKKSLKREHMNNF